MRSLERVGATRVPSSSENRNAFFLSHKLLGHLSLHIELISNLNDITPYLRQQPVDLLIYDERNGQIAAPDALRKIRSDVAKLAELWGPDFIFPMSRVVAILSKEHASDAFELGRVHVRDVFIDPKSTPLVLRWIHRTLTKGIVRQERVGMALDGGGLEGFLFQLGVLHALEQALSGRPLDNAHSYAGVSAGAISAAMIASKIPIEEVIKAAFGCSENLRPLKGSMLFDLASSDIAKRLLSAPLQWRGGDQQKLLDSILQIVPTGIFKGDGLQNYFSHAFEMYGQDDNFDAIGPNLYIGATDQDSFEHVIFGKSPYRDVSITDALRASAAVPPFFTPKKIHDRWYIDGGITQNCDVEQLVSDNCRLIFVIDPMKPYEVNIPGAANKFGGVHNVIQMIKALIYTRFQTSMSHLTERFPDVDFIFIQPDEECAKLMRGAPMRFFVRKQIITAAYKQTLRQLRQRHHIYQAKLQRFGFTLAAINELKHLEQNPPYPLNGQKKRSGAA